MTYGEIKFATSVNTLRSSKASLSVKLEHQLLVMKEAPYSPNQESSDHASSDANLPNNVEDASIVNQSSIIDHSYGIEHAPDNQGPEFDGEVPPAYHQLEFEGGNVTAVPMRI